MYTNKQGTAKHKGVNRYQQGKNTGDGTRNLCFSRETTHRFLTLGLIYFLLIYFFLRQLGTPNLDTRQILVLYVRTLHAPKLFTWI